MKLFSMLGKIFVAVLVLVGLLVSISLKVQASQKISTNQQYIEKLKSEKSINIDSIDDVFSFVFDSLPEKVNVYPTENYFYYTFYHNGVPIEGNIRLDILDRDKGVVHFAYFSRYTRWSDEVVSKYKKVSSLDGLNVVKLGDLSYRLTYNNKSVTFNLNDLSKTKPPASKIRENEIYLGPVYDESGIEFYLVYNSNIKNFHYVLNESNKIPELLVPSSIDTNIYIGERTGFAFYKDRYLERMILVGIYEGNSMVNNYFDGPFDQLPDNFIKGNSLMNAFIDQSPELRGKIDRFGNSDNGLSRAMIAPYIHYSSEGDLSVIISCLADSGESVSKYYSCFKEHDRYNFDERYET